MVDIAIRVFRILEATNYGDSPSPAFAKANHGVIHVVYEKGDKKNKFFDIDLKSKVINFYEHANCYSTKQECEKLIEESKKEGYTIRGEDYIL